MNKKFEVDILSASNFTSFGFCLSSRKYSTPSYRYGFNGKEKDDEAKGGGNSYDFGARIYDCRLGVFLSIDPLASDYPFSSPYVYAANNPILYIDVLGMGPELAADGSDVLLAPGAQITSTFSCEKEYSVTNSQGEKVTVNVFGGSVKTFNYEGREFTANFDKETGAFKGYYTTVNDSKTSYSEYLKPDFVGRAGWGAMAPKTGEGFSYDKISEPLEDYYNTIVIHHSGNSNMHTVKEVQEEHQKDGKADIGYHFAIDLQGKIYIGRPIGIKGAHVDGANTGKIGIVLLGDFDSVNDGVLWDYNGEDKMSAEMKTAVTKLVTYLAVKYGIEFVGVHNEVNCGNRECPGLEGKAAMVKIREVLKMKKPACATSGN